MIISDVDLIALAFGAFNVLRLASYFPQIAAVATGSARRNRNLLLLLVVVDWRQRQHGVLRLGAAGRPWASVDQCIQCGMLPSGPSLGRMEALVRPLSSINFATRQILRQRRKHGGGLTCELVRCRQS